MKNKIVTTFILLVIGMFLTINPAFAGDRVKVYQMAESGTTIEFEMTLEEIAAEDAAQAERAVLKEANKNNPQKRVKVFEMGESGQSFSFPSTAEEIATEDTENARLAALQKAKSEKQEKQVITHEFAESGVSVAFPVETSGKVGREAVAERNSIEDLKM